MNDQNPNLSFPSSLDTFHQVEHHISDLTKNFASTYYKHMAKQELCQYHFMQLCDESEKKQILENIKIQQYYPNQIIAAQYETCHHIQLVLEGTIRVCTYSIDGKQIINGFIPTGTLINIFPFITQKKFQRHQIAHEMTILAKIPGQTFLQIMQKNSQLLYYIFELICKRQLKLFDTALYQNTQSLRVQLAYRLVELAENFSVHFNENIKLQIKLSQENFADLLQTTRQRINKEFLWLEQEKIAVAKYNQIHILDLDRLKSLTKIKE